MPRTLTVEPDSGGTLLMSGAYLAMCHSCAYSQGFKFGLGTMYTSIDRAVHLVDPRWRFQVQVILNHNHVSKTAFGYRAFHCAECHHLSDGFWVRIQHDDYQIFETTFRCPKCDIEMNPVTKPDKLKALPCPDCKDGSLETVRIMPWD